MPNRKTYSAALKGAAVAAVVTLAAGSAAQAQMKGNFDDADANHDGHVTLSEFETYVTNQLMAGTGKKAQKFQQMTADERNSRLQARFEQLDATHKGYLEKSDWDAPKSE